jgi:hypothetical protein
MKKGLLLVLAIISANLSIAQSDNHFDKKDIMLELGVLPALAVNGKAGYAIFPNTLIGVEFTSQLLITQRNEIGVFGRRYLLQKRFDVYLQGGVSYGHYRPFNLGLDRPKTKFEVRNYDPFNAVKLTGGGGISHRINHRLAIGAETALGFTNHRNSSFLTFLLTCNYRLPANK